MRILRFCYIGKTKRIRVRQEKDNEEKVSIERKVMVVVMIM